MNELATQPWPYLAVAVVTALLLGRRLRVWGFGFGVEVDHVAEPKTGRNGRRRLPARKRKGR